MKPKRCACCCSPARRSIASLAPSFAANYEGVGIDEHAQGAAKPLGFADAEETALGATMVKREYERILEEEKRDVLISSCCHSINLLIQKYYPAALPYLADVASPMQAHCKDIKKRYPGREDRLYRPLRGQKGRGGALSTGIVDAVLTFEELTAMAGRARALRWKKTRDHDAQSRARFFPTTGGILKTMAQDAPGYTYLALDGTENCKAALQRYRKRQDSPLLYRNVRVRGQLHRRPHHGKAAPYAAQGLPVHRRLRGRSGF